MRNKVTIKEVAKEAGVSIATVSYVINKVDKVTEETKNKVLETINRLGYKPNLTARNLVKKESALIGILVPVKFEDKRSIFTDNPFFEEFFTGVEYKARELGYSTLVVGSNDEQKSIEKLQEYFLCGVLALGSYNNSLFKSLEELELPTVVIDGEWTSNKFSYIFTDDESGAYEATQYLITKGHRNICFLTGYIKESFIHENRLKGYIKALEDNNIPFKKEYVIEQKVTYEGGIEAAEKIAELKEEITAVFSMSDILAIGLVKGLYRKNIYVPKDISIIGFDDIKNSKYFIPEITTMAQDIFGKGEKAVDILINNLDKNKKFIGKYVSPVKLIERESVQENRKK